MQRLEISHLRPKEYGLGPVAVYPDDIYKQRYQFTKTETRIVKKNLSRAVVLKLCVRKYRFLLKNLNKSIRNSKTRALFLVFWSSARILF